MTPAFALRRPAGFRTDSGLAALTDRTIRATGKIGAADGLTKAFHQYVKFCQFVGAPRSILMVAVFVVVFLGERLTLPNWRGIVLIAYKA